jgi:hypothetical protein
VPGGIALFTNEMLGKRKLRKGILT